MGTLLDALELKQSENPQMKKMKIHKLRKLKSTNEEEIKNPQMKNLKNHK